MYNLCLILVIFGNLVGNLAKKFRNSVPEKFSGSAKYKYRTMHSTPLALKFLFKSHVLLVNISRKLSLVQSYKS